VGFEGPAKTSLLPKEDKLRKKYASVIMRSHEYIILIHCSKKPNKKTQFLDCAFR